MLIVTSCTMRMPAHIRKVLKYQSGKLPLLHASAKLSKPNGPDGVSEAMSTGTPGRSEATAIQANGTAQTSAAALAASSAQREVRLVMRWCPEAAPHPPTLRVGPSLSPLAGRGDMHRRAPSPRL